MGLHLSSFTILGTLDKELLHRKAGMSSFPHYFSSHPLPYPFKWAMVPSSWCFISLRSIVCSGRSGGGGKVLLAEHPWGLYMLLTLPPTLPWKHTLAVHTTDLCREWQTPAYTLAQYLPQTALHKTTQSWGFCPKQSLAVWIRSE